MEKNNIKTEEVENKTIIEEKNNQNIDLAKKEEFIEKDSQNNDLSEKEELKENGKGKKKYILCIVLISIVLIIGLVFSTIFAILNINNNNIVSGVKIEGIDVSGLTKEEAKSKINIMYEEKKQKDIKLKYEEYETTINPEIVEIKYDIEGAIEEAISIGKNNNIIVNNYNILWALFGKKDINVNMTINEEIAKKNIDDIGKNITGAVIEADYYIEGDKLIITKGKEGLKVDTEILMNKLKNNLQDININQEYIDIPVTNKIPDEINIEKIYEEVHKEVQDAYYTKDPFTIHPEVEGVDFNLEEAKTILQEDKEEYVIQLTITKPKITTAQIGSEAFPDLLATYTTRYDASDTNRTTNLRIACQKINEKVVLPGEIFSYNKTLGERSIATGYKNAKVYENGQVVDGIGGGICQISSTLYNAVLMSNLEVTERSNHQFVTSYAPAGRDATVVYGQTDFKFKNPRTYAVKIKASISGGVATVSIYGIKEENEYTVTFSTKTVSTIPYTVKYVDDASLAAGTEKVKQKGANGIITETYIIKSLNGKVVSTKLLSKDTYNAMQRIILRGTKGATTSIEINTNINNKESTSVVTQDKKIETKPVENMIKENKEVTNNTQNNNTVND